MRATYSEITSDCSINGVDFAKATAHLAKSATVQVSDRMSKFKVFECIAGIQERYDIKEADIDQLLILIKEDIQQAILESEIE